MYSTSTRSRSSSRSPCRTDASGEGLYLSDAIWEDDEDDYLHSPVRTTYGFFSGTGTNLSSQSLNQVTVPVRKYKTSPAKSPCQVATKLTVQVSESSQTTCEDKSKTPKASKSRRRSHDDDNNPVIKRSPRSSSSLKLNENSGESGKEKKSSFSDKDNGMGERKSSRSSRSSATSKYSGSGKDSSRRERSNEAIYLKVSVVSLQSSLPVALVWFFLNLFHNIADFG